MFQPFALRATLFGCAEQHEHRLKSQVAKSYDLRLILLTWNLSTQPAKTCDNCRRDLVKSIVRCLVAYNSSTQPKQSAKTYDNCRRQEMPKREKTWIILLHRFMHVFVLCKPSDLCMSMHTFVYVYACVRNVQLSCSLLYMRPHTSVGIVAAGNSTCDSKF